MTRAESPAPNDHDLCLMLFSNNQCHVPPLPNLRLSTIQSLAQNESFENLFEHRLHVGYLPWDVLIDSSFHSTIPPSLNSHSTCTM